MSLWFGVISQVTPNLNKTFFCYSSEYGIQFLPHKMKVYTQQQRLSCGFGIYTIAIILKFIVYGRKTSFDNMVDLERERFPFFLIGLSCFVFGRMKIKLLNLQKAKHNNTVFEHDKGNIFKSFTK